MKKSVSILVILVLLLGLFVSCSKQLVLGYISGITDMLFTFYREKPQLPVSGLTGTHTGTISGTTFTKTWDLFVEYDAVGFSGEFSVKIIMEEDIDLGTCNFVHFEINGKEYTEEQVTAFLGK